MHAISVVTDLLYVAFTIWLKIGLGHKTQMAETEPSASRDKTKTLRQDIGMSRDGDVETETTTLLPSSTLTKYKIPGTRTSLGS